MVFWIHYISLQLKIVLKYFAIVKSHMRIKSRWFYSLVHKSSICAFIKNLFGECRTVVTFTNVVPSTTLPNRNSAETSPASHGVASARPSLFSCFFLKLPFQKMARSAPLEVRLSQKSRREEKGFLKL